MANKSEKFEPELLLDYGFGNINKDLSDISNDIEILQGMKNLKKSESELIAQINFMKKRYSAISVNIFEKKAYAALGINKLSLADSKVIQNSTETDIKSKSGFDKNQYVSKETQEEIDDFLKEKKNLSSNEIAAKKAEIDKKIEELKDEGKVADAEAWEKTLEDEKTDIKNIEEIKKKCKKPGYAKRNPKACLELLKTDDAEDKRLKKKCLKGSLYFKSKKGNAVCQSVLSEKEFSEIEVNRGFLGLGKNWKDKCGKKAADLNGTDTKKAGKAITWFGRFSRVDNCKRYGGWYFSNDNGRFTAVEGDMTEDSTGKKCWNYILGDGKGATACSSE